jgi:nondiscriminating glutamyl-tRNA synthetase
MSSPVITRFAPSPTGQLHLGNVRTALFAWLWARRMQGQFILRVEDTDLERSSEANIAALQHDLAWLGLSVDLGPGADSPKGPFRQTERSAIYRDAMATLSAQGRVYPCFCSEVDLEMEKRQARAAKRPPVYSGKCAHLSPEQRASRQAANEPHTLRFKLNERENIRYTDAVRGEQSFLSNDLGDFVIARSDGSVGFLFSNAVDDAKMGVTHVLRGEDHVSNTPRQIAIMQALNASTPVYAHLPLLVGDNGAPLSKRDGSASVAYFREQGYLPIALTNLLFRLGHHCSESKLLTLAEMAPLFSLDALGRAPARFDEQQLKHWQREAVQAAPLSTLLPWFETGRSASETERFATLLKSNALLPADAQEWVSRVQVGPREYSEEASLGIRLAGSDFFAKLVTALPQLSPAQSAQWLKQVRLDSGLNGPQFFKPVRLALTGRLDGPDLAALLQLMPPELIRTSLERARDLARSNQ